MTLFLYPTTSPVKPFYGANGLPLENGYIRYGNANQNPVTNPIQMYWDAAGTIPAPQPFRTMGGFINRQGTPANVYATGDCSVAVWDSAGRMVMYSPVSIDLQLALAITGSGTAAAIPLVDAGGYFTTDNVEAAFQELAGPGFITLTRLAAAVQALLVPTGVVLDYVGTTAPTGWVLGAGGLTIGSAASGGTSRANADTVTLYTLLWNNYSNTALVIQDSAGTPTTRGASASNDFAANKRMPLPDYGGRVRAGREGTATRLTTAGSGIDGATQGVAGGAQNVVLITANLATHTHAGTQSTHTHTVTDPTHNHTQNAHTHTATDSGHLHGYGFVTGAVQGGSGANVCSTVENEAAQNTTSAAANVTNANATATNIAAATGISLVAASAGAITVANAGSDTAHFNCQPTIIDTVIIKL